MKTFLQDKVPFYNSLVLPVHWVKAVAAGVRYGWPGRRMTVIGVTGTNGKTSTCFMIWKMLNEAGYRTGLLTTVGWGGVSGRDEDVVRQVEHMTTADVMTLNRRMREIADAGAEFLVLEVTSHALAQFRTLGVPIEVGVMTNVTHEHLDYHRTFERYVGAKCKLFRKAKYGVINAEDKSARRFKEVVGEGNYITYGVKKGDLRAFDVKLGISGVKYSCGDILVERSERAVGVTDASQYKVGRIEVKTQIPGEFTVYNSLAAVAVGLRLGLNETEVAEGVGALEAVEGRMNRVELGQDFGVIVDYAHTPDAFLKVFASVTPEERLRTISASADALLPRRTQSTPRSATPTSLNSSHKRSSGRIISVFGGAGRRDETTRAERGEIAAKYSDVVIITEDDSRDEDPAEIAEMFAEGARRGGMKDGENLLVILDREEAINEACRMAKKGDLVLVLGKGHEKTILRADGAHEFEDLKVTEKAVRKVMRGSSS